MGKRVAKPIDPRGNLEKLLGNAPVSDWTMISFGKFFESLEDFHRTGIYKKYDAGDTGLHSDSGYHRRKWSALSDPTRGKIARDCASAWGRPFIASRSWFHFVHRGGERHWESIGGVVRVPKTKKLQIINSWALMLASDKEDAPVKARTFAGYYEFYFQGEFWQKFYDLTQTDPDWRKAIGLPPLTKPRKRVTSQGDQPLKQAA